MNLMKEQEEVVKNCLNTLTARQADKMVEARLIAYAKQFKPKKDVCHERRIFRTKKRDHKFEKKASPSGVLSLGILR